MSELVGTMRKNNKFYETRHYDPPRNRRVYAGAKAALGYFWEFLVLVSKPWLTVLPVCFVFGLAVSFLAQRATPRTTPEVFYDAVLATIVSDFYLGAVVAVFMLYRAIFK